MIRYIDQATQALKNRLFRRRYSYQALFLNEQGKLNEFGQVVIADLTRFCRGLTSITIASTGDGHTDLFRTGVAEGRREVLLYILKQTGQDLSSLMDTVQAEEDVLSR